MAKQETSIQIYPDFMLRVFEQICVKYMDGGAGASYKHAKHHMPAIQEFKVDWELAGVRCWQSRWGREVVDWT